MPVLFFCTPPFQSHAHTPEFYSVCLFTLQLRLISNKLNLKSSLTSLKTKEKDRFKSENMVFEFPNSL